METTFRLETIKILKKAKRPLDANEITKEILKRGNVKTRGATPKYTVYSLIITEIKRKGSKSAFVKTSDGLFTLNKSQLK